MDEKTINQVLNIVKEHNGIKAIEISKIMKCSKKEVNKALYGILSNSCRKDEQHRWYFNCEEAKAAQEAFLCDELIQQFEGKNFDVAQLEEYLKLIESLK